jgi:mono/diheme cytochrome c family protein
MTPTRINLLLAGLLLAGLALAGTLDTDPTKRNWDLFRAMKHSPAYKSFELHDQFASGRTMQLPPPGTIPRGALPLHYSSAKEDAVRAGEELQNPFPATDDSSPATASTLQSPRLQSQERGALLYRIHCQACHGATGAGDGPVAQRGFPPPPPLSTGKSAQMKDGQVFHILTWGQGSMPALANQIDRQQRWDLVNFVRSIQAAAASAPPQAVDNSDPATPPSPGNSPP